MQKTARFLLGVLSVIAIIFGLVGMTVSAIGGAASVAGGILLWPSVGDKASRLTRRRWPVLVVGIIIAFFAGPLISSLTAPSVEETALMAEEREAERAAKAEERALADAKKTEERQRRDCSDNAMAYIMSRRFVERALVAPSTAKFPSFHAGDVYSAQTGDCRFRVDAYVDAQNNFGAMVRTRYSIDMEYLPGSKNWRGTNLRM